VAASAQSGGCSSLGAPAFWASIPAGLLLLLNWQVWSGVLLYGGSVTREPPRFAARCLRFVGWSVIGHDLVGEVLDCSSSFSWPSTFSGPSCMWCGQTRARGLRLYTAAAHLPTR